MSLQSENDLDFEIEQIKQIAAERNVSFGDAMTVWNAGIRPRSEERPWAVAGAVDVRRAA